MASNNNKTQYLRERLKDNSGKWLGFKTGKKNEIMVRIRRNARKHFYLIVERYVTDNKVIVRDFNGKEYGVAIRFDNDSFSLEPNLKGK